MTYTNALDWLYSTQLFGIKLGLEAPYRLLKEFHALPRAETTIIQIAGTNGKGSTAAFLDSLLRTAGRRCGLFTSPHLLDYRERMRVNGVMISKDECLRHLIELKQLVSSWEHHPTFFELTLALAMRYFNEQECSHIILEAGMGGRLDATTALPADLSLITPIGLDHTQWLGNTLSEIALEKAGIIRPHIPVISAPQDEEAMAVLHQSSQEKKAPFTVIKEPFPESLRQLPGPHQQWNAAMALAAMKQLHQPLSSTQARHALHTTTHAGRFEIIPSPSLDTTESPPPLILDAAHNPHAARSLLQTWELAFPAQKAHVIFGAVEHKDVAQILHLITPLTKHLHLVAPQTARALSPASLYQHVPLSLQPITSRHSSLEDAFLCAQKQATQDASPILITGSLFLLGQSKALLKNSPYRSSDQ